MRKKLVVFGDKEQWLNLRDCCRVCQVLSWKTCTLTLSHNTRRTPYILTVLGREISPVRAAARKSASDEFDKTALKALVALPRLNILMVSEERKRFVFVFANEDAYRRAAF
jgi:hypothetical protein